MEKIKYPYSIKLPSYLGRSICQERKIKGMTQIELASWTNTSAKFISEVEQGKNTVQLDKVFDLIKALDLNIYITNTPRDKG